MHTSCCSQVCVDKFTYTWQLAASFAKESFLAATHVFNQTSRLCLLSISG
uniref:Uncharacterized protein n=1 Tax=Octopus bimaculoides TaxID=37653 RepID=A0A0L8HK05_OCTBM